MKHSAKRIKNGHYFYRGYEIKRNRGWWSVWARFEDGRLGCLATYKRNLNEAKGTCDFFEGHIAKQYT